MLFPCRGIRTSAPLFPSRDPASFQISYSLGASYVLIAKDLVTYAREPMPRVLYSLEQKSTIKSHKWSHSPLLPLRYCDCVSTSKDRSCLTLGFLFSGIILAVVFIRIKKDKGNDNVENPQSPETRPLRS